MKHYFYINNGEQVGPFPLEQFRHIGITPDTYVWSEGMPEWKKASEVTDFQAILSPAQAPQGNPYAQGGPQNPATPGQTGYQQPAYQQPGPQYNPYGPPQGIPMGTYERKRPIPNSIAVLVLGICSIPFGFCWGVGIVPGIIGLALAGPAKKEWEAAPDTFDQASYNNLNAGKICSIVGISLGVLFLILALVSVSSRGRFYY